MTLFLLKLLLLGHIYTQNCLKISYYNYCNFTFKKVSLSIQKRHLLIYEINVKSFLPAVNLNSNYILNGLWYEPETL